MLLSKIVGVAITAFFVIFLTIYLLSYFVIFKSKMKLTMISKNTSTLNHFRLLPDKYNIVEVSVFYEYQCEDSRQFFIYQLLPTVEKLQSNVVVNLIPYGKATTQELDNYTYIFHCHHGPTECKGNIINACIIELIHDELIRLKLITCMINFNTYSVEDIAMTCCDDYNVNWFDIKDCLDSRTGAEIFKFFGDITTNIVPYMAFVPTILLDRELKNQFMSLYSLETLIRKMIKNKTLASHLES